jgi:hypothetical protein
MFKKLPGHCACSDCSTTELCRQPDVVIVFDGAYFMGKCHVCGTEYLLGWLTNYEGPAQGSKS